MRRRIVIILSFIVLISVCLGACNREEGGVTDTATDSAEVSETDAVKSEWDRATLIWTSNTDISFELRVRPGFEYELIPDEDNAGCTFTENDGKSVYLIVQGLDYENTFEQLIFYLKSLNPEELSVGKDSNTVITVHNADETEIISKLSDVRCLTTKAISTAAADEFFSNVMIKVEGKEYSPLDLSEEFDSAD